MQIGDFFCTILEIVSLCANNSNPNQNNTQECVNEIRSYCNKNSSRLYREYFSDDKCESKPILGFEYTCGKTKYNANSTLNNTLTISYECVNTSSKNEMVFNCTYQPILNKEAVVSVVVLAVIGVTGNSIALYVFSRLNLSEKSLSRYIVIGIVFNTINGLFAFAAFFPNYFIEKTRISRKLYLYITFVVTTFSSWNNVLILIDTYISIKFIASFRIRRKLSFQIVAVLSQFMLSCSLNSQHFKFGVCYLEKDTESFAQVLYFAISEVIIPFSLRILFSLLILYEIIQSKIKSKQTNLENVKKISKIMLGLNILYLSFNLPYSIVMLISTSKSAIKIPEIVTNLFTHLRFIYFYLDLLIYFINNSLFRKYCCTCLTTCSCKNLTV